MAAQIFNITGTYNLVADPNWKNLPIQEVRMECNTTGAPVIINLPTIAKLEGFYNVKIFVIDKTGNAATNNITINAGTANTIDGASAKVLSTNGAMCELQIMSSTQILSVGTSTPSVAQVYKFERVLTRAELIALNGTPIYITEADLGITAGQKAKFRQLDTEWHVSPDGVAFTQTAPTAIVLKTTTVATAITNLPMNDVVGVATDMVLQTNTMSAALGSAQIITISPTVSYYLEAAGGVIGGGGAAAQIKAVFYYEKVTV